MYDAPLPELRWLRGVRPERMGARSVLRLAPHTPAPPGGENILRKSLIAALVAVFVLGISSVALGAFSQVFEQNFTVTKKNKATGINTNIEAKDDPGVKPKETSKVIIKFQKGTKFNYNVPAICKLT